MIEKTVLKESHKGAVASMVFSKDGKIIASGGEDMFIRVWSIDSKKPLWVEPKDPHHAAKVSVLIIDNSNGQILSGGEDNTLRVWNLKDGKPINEAMLHNSSVTGIKLWDAGGKSKIKILLLLYLLRVRFIYGIYLQGSYLHRQQLLQVI